MIQCIKNTVVDLTTVEFIGLGNSGNDSAFQRVCLCGTSRQIRPLLHLKRDKSIIKYVDGIEDRKREAKYVCFLV